MTSAAGGANFAEVAFAFRIAPSALASGIVFGGRDGQSSAGCCPP